jgi:hypothetical protein
MGGRPGRDFRRHHRRNPARCQRISVAGWTTTNADRQSKHRDRSISVTRVAASARLGFTSRSRYRASWRRRNRFSASNDSRGRSKSLHHWSRTQVSRTTMENALNTPRSCHSCERWPLSRSRSNFCGRQRRSSTRASRDDRMSLLWTRGAVPLQRCVRAGREGR